MMTKPLRTSSLLLTVAVVTISAPAIIFAFSSTCTRQTHNKKPTTSVLFFSSKLQEWKIQLDAREEEARNNSNNIENLESLVFDDEVEDGFEDDASSRPSISALSPEQLRQLRREIIARRRQRQNKIEDNRRTQQDFSFIFIALVPCLLAFVTWEGLSRSVAQWISENAAVGLAVDGNKFASDLLRPTITGVVVPVISIALATLVSTTVNVLRARQVDIRALINKEACDLRLLRRAIFGMFGTRQHSGRRSRALTLLKRYVEQIDRECNAGAIESLQVLELSGGVATNELDELSAMLHGVEGASANRQGSVDSADAIISRLNSFRSDRVALLLTDFPDLHWVVLISLSVSICVVFLLESNQLVNQYLNSIQLRSLFALLVGVFSATATLIVDLSSPFDGSFSVAGTSAQVGDLRLCLLEDAREAKREAVQLSFSTFRFFPSPEDGGSGILLGATNPMKGASRRDMSPSRFGNNFVSTVYFHLLTGPFGSNVRALGELVAWVATTVWKKTRSFLALRGGFR